MIPRIVEIIGNAEILRYLLDGFFKDWPGSYEILTADTQEHLFQSSEYERQLPFCWQLRHSAQGADFCQKCQLKYAEIAARRKEPLVYLCDAGLLEIAVPIIVDDDLVATIFCAQGRPSDAEQERQGFQLMTEAEAKLGYSSGTLHALRDQVSIIGVEKIGLIRDQLWQMVAHLSNLAHEKMVLQYQLGESRRIREASDVIGGVIETLDLFWDKMSQVLSHISDVIGANAAALLMYEYRPGANDYLPVVKGVYGLPNTLMGQAFSANDREFSQVLRGMKPEAIRFGEFRRAGTICWQVSQLPGMKELIDTVALIPMRLDPREKGVLVFFLSKLGDTSRSLPILKELELLIPVTERIATAYQNCRLHAERRKQGKVRGDWLNNVSHQLIAPLTGIQGHAENLARWMNAWAELVRGQGERMEADRRITIEITGPQINRMTHTLESIVWMTGWVSRLARNFAWMAEIDHEKGYLAREIVSNMPALLIGCARNVQGMARERLIRRVHVNPETTQTMDNKVSLNRVLFAQAIGNLLDNAIKYSDKQTDILIDGHVTDEWGVIEITNRGIPIRHEEVERIFERDYRTEPARARYAAGTGLGLPIARDIIEQHGGRLTVNPSRSIHEAGYSGYETTFTIKLPLIPSRTV